MKGVNQGVRGVIYRMKGVKNLSEGVKNLSRRVNQGMKGVIYRVRVVKNRMKRLFHPFCPVLKVSDTQTTGGISNTATIYQSPPVKSISRV